jgi:hypothetical protein
MLYSDRIADAASSDAVTDSNFAIRELHSAVFQSVVPSVQLFANLPLIKKQSIGKENEKEEICDKRWSFLVSYGLQSHS